MADLLLPKRTSSPQDDSQNDRFLGKMSRMSLMREATDGSLPRKDRTPALKKPSHRSVCRCAVLFLIRFLRPNIVHDRLGGRRRHRSWKEGFFSAGV
jgi:hypothetical protein